MIPAIVATASGAVGNELTFTFPDVLTAIRVCTENDIAVLGVEIFLVQSNKFQASGCSTYDLQMGSWGEVGVSDWSRYVKYNNRLAEEFIRQNPTGDEHVYVLTNSSWQEFCQLQQKGRKL